MSDHKQSGTPPSEQPFMPTGIPKPTFGEANRVWWRIGILSFGGPAAQIALMHRELVDERSWLTERQFLNALSFCMLLPGPEAMQLATYSGWRLHGMVGGLIAGFAFVLPGALVVLALARLYLLYGDLPLSAAFFWGVKAAVLIIVLEALLKVARKALHGLDHWLIAALSFVGIFLLDLPFPLIIAAAALWGLWRGERSTASDSGHKDHAPATHGIVSPMVTLRTIALWLVLWFAPLALLWALSPLPVFGALGLFFAKLATVTFGGAYAVLAYMAQDAVNLHGWLSAAEMMDGLGLAETTPGPLILVTEFVGFLAAARAAGEPSLWLGLAGALVTLWATFAPCYLWIFAGAPYIDWFGTRPRLRAALQAITAAVVGVILNLSLWFALHVLFDHVGQITLGPVRLYSPQWDSINMAQLALTAFAALLLHWRKWSVLKALAACSLAGLGLGLVVAQ